MLRELKGCDTTEDENNWQSTLVQEPCEDLINISYLFIVSCKQRLRCARHAGVTTDEGSPRWIIPRPLNMVRDIEEVCTLPGNGVHA